MAAVDYPACLRELLDSEIFGESVSLALLEVVKSERDRYHFATLLQLETETKARLRPLLYRYEVSLAEPRPEEVIAEAVAGYLANDWEAFCEANIPIVQSYLDRFREIVALGPAEDREILESMVRHESAILRWFEMESRGERQGSLDAVIAELQYPLHSGRA